jgi:hypothetical protein
MHFDKLTDPESEHWQWPLHYIDEAASDEKNTAIAA